MKNNFQARRELSASHANMEIDANSQPGWSDCEKAIARGFLWPHHTLKPDHIEDTMMAAPKTKRRAAVLFVAATLLAPAYAASASPECDEIGNLGRFIMEKRQADVVKDEVREAIYAKSYREQAFGIVLLDEAYKVDVKSTYSSKKNQIDNFTVTAIQGCQAIITH